MQFPGFFIICSNFTQAEKENTDKMTDRLFFLIKVSSQASKDYKNHHPSFTWKKSSLLIFSSSRYLDLVVVLL